MTFRGALQWVVFAGLLGLVLMWLRSGGQGDDEQKVFLLGLDSASVVGLRVENAEGRTDAVTRVGDGQWVLSFEDGDAKISEWTAQESRVRGGIRMLVAEEFRVREAPETPLSEPPIGSVVVQLRGGVETELVFESRGVGGRVPVHLRSGSEIRYGWSDRSLVDMFLISGLAPWRDRAFGARAAQADSFTIEALENRVSLRRVGGRWLIEDPVLLEANQEFVETVLGKISEMQIERFLDGADPGQQAYGLIDPMGLIEIGWGGRGDNPESAHRRLLLGARSNASGSILHALAEWRIGSRDFDPRVVTIGVPEFPVSVAPYLRRTGSSLRSADIRGVSVRRRSEREVVSALTRTIDGWVLNDEPDRDGIGEAISSFVTERTSVQTDLITHAELESLPGYLGEFGLVAGGGVEAEVFLVALPTEITPSLRLVGKDLGDGVHAVWSYSGAEADVLVRWFVERFGI